MGYRGSGIGKESVLLEREDRQVKEVFSSGKRKEWEIEKHSSERTDEGR